MSFKATNDDYFWDPDYPEASILNDVASGLYFISIVVYIIFVVPRVCTRRPLENRPATRAEIIGALSASVIFIVGSMLSIASICINGNLSNAWIAVPVVIIILCIFPLTRNSIDLHEYDEGAKDLIDQEEVFILRREDVVVMGPAHKD